MIRPLGKRVLARKENPETKTASGIILPEAAQEKTQIASVVAIGPDKEIMVKPGDKIMYEKYSGTSIKIDGDEYLVLQNENIIAIVE